MSHVIFNLSNMYHIIFHLHTQLLKALANEKRLEIIHLLRDRELTVSEIQTMLDLEQANLSQHLMVLRKLDVVTTRKDGKEVYYKLSHKNFIKASDLIREVLIDQKRENKILIELGKDIDKFLPLAHDPVCQMRISPKLASYATIYKNNNYFFCAEGCLEKFNHNPEKYIKK